VVAAYITKRSQRPGLDDWVGHTYGFAGTLLHHLTRRPAPPSVIAISAQHLLEAQALADLSTQKDPPDRLKATEALARCIEIVARERSKKTKDKAVQMR
jgi:hypothetical protein